MNLQEQPLMLLNEGVQTVDCAHGNGMLHEEHEVIHMQLPAQPDWVGFITDKRFQKCTAVYCKVKNLGTCGAIKNIQCKSDMRSVTEC
eukprot:5028250-Pleurochrysis_carterae.AAC.1